MSWRIPDDLATELESRVEQLGFELVELQRAGTPRRPILRLSADRPDSVPGEGITVEDCRRISRALEQYLDERSDLSSTYLLEVSSPGVERPLVRSRDWTRFAGREVAVQGNAPLAGGARTLRGTLLGPVESAGEAEQVAVQLPDGETVQIARSQIKRAHLVFEWGAKQPKP